MKEEEIIKRIEEGLVIIKANPSRLYNYLGQIFSLLDKLSDKEITMDLKGKFMELQSITDERSVVVKVEEIRVLLIKMKNMEIYEKSFLAAKYGMKKVERSKRYQQDLKIYAGFMKSIKSTEYDLLKSPLYIKNYHEVIKNHRKYDKYLHARIRGNLRIMYKIKNGILIFDEIITKNEFDSTR